MSRGPGRRQRALLAALASLPRHERGAVRAVPVGCSDAEAVCWRRAARTLCLGGAVRAIYRREQDRGDRRAWRVVLYLTPVGSTVQGNAYPAHSPSWIEPPMTGPEFFLSLPMPLQRHLLSRTGLHVPRAVMREVSREYLAESMAS